MRLNPKLLFKIGVPGFDDSGRGDRGCDGPPMDSRFGAYDQANGTVDHFRHDSDCDRNKPLNRVTTQVGFGGRDGPPHSLPLVHSHVNETFQNMLKGNAVVSRGWSGSLNTPRTLVGTGASRCERLDLKQVNSGHDIDHEGRVRAFVDPDDGDTREEILEGEDTDLHHHHVGIDRGNSENKSFNHQPLSKAKITRFDENYGGICVDYGHPLNSGSVDGICSIPNGQIDVSYQHETNVGFVRRNHTHCDNGGDCIDGVKADLNFNNCISNNESVERRVHDMGCERDYVGVGTQSFLHSKASKPLRVLHHNPKLKTALIIRAFVGAATLLGIMRCDATGRLLRNKDRGANGGGFFGERQHEPQTISLLKLFPIIGINEEDLDKSIVDIESPSHLSADEPSVAYSRLNTISDEKFSQKKSIHTENLLSDNLVSEFEEKLKHGNTYDGSYIDMTLLVEDENIGKQAVLFDSESSENDFAGIQKRRLQSDSYKIKSMSNTNLCLANPNGWAKMEECSDKTTQNFSYVSSSREIKYGLKCLDYNSDTTLVFIHDCHGDKNQKWYYNYKTMELKTLKDEKCLDMPGSREMYMSPCHGGLNQKFQMPSDWQMLPLSSDFTDRVSVESNLNLCMTLGSSAVMATCQPNNANQVIPYDPSTRNIKFGAQCLNYNFNDGRVYPRACHHDINQKWYYNSATKELKTIWDEKCLDMSSSNTLYMNSCHGGTNQKFKIPSGWEMLPLSSNFTDRVSVVSNLNLCMTVLADSNASMRTCKWGDSSQAFSYDSSKRAIKINGKCLDYNYSNGNVYLHSCHGKKNQVWYYDKNTYQVKSLYNENCLDLNSSSNLYMTSCNANDSQKIQVPSMWNILPLSADFTNRVSVVSNPNLCLTSQGGDAVMATCQADNLSQIFTYESPSRRIIIDGKCLNYNPITNNVYPRECHEEKNQKWHYNSVTKEIRTLFDEKCLDMSSSKNIYMYPCHGGANQKFFLPSSWDMTPSPITARKVRLEKTGDFISLAEVEVYDEANINVALGKATSQTSTFQSAVASMGVDGDISGNQGTLFMTLDRGYEYWEVDLGKNVNISRVVVHNSAGTDRYRLSNMTILLLRGDSFVAGYKLGLISNEKVVPTISSSFLFPDFIQIGVWRIAHSFDSLFNSYLSFSTRLHFKQSFSVFRNDGTVINEKVNHEYHGWAYNSTTGPTFSGKGVVYGDHAVQIRDWRIRQIDYHHLSVTSESGRVSRIFRSDGAILPRNDDFNGYKKELGQPTCAFLTTNFLQIGDWRIGGSRIGSWNYLSLGHSGGIRNLWYRHDGSAHLKNGTDVNIWQQSGVYVDGSDHRGCQSVRLMNVADSGMKCLFVDNDTTKFTACSTDDIKQRFFVRAQQLGGFILQPAATDAMDKCVNTDDGLSIVVCVWNNLPKWTINGNGRIVPLSAQTKCLTHDTSNDNDAKVTACVKDDYSSHISIIPFRPSSQSDTAFPFLEPGLTFIYPNSGVQLFGDGAYGSFKIDGWDTRLTDDTTLSFKFQVDGVTSSGTFLVCIAISGVVESYCLNLLDPILGFVTGVEGSYDLNFSRDLKRNSNYGMLDFKYKSQIISSIQFKQSGSTSSRSRVHSVHLYNPGTAELVERKHDEITVQLLFPSDAKTNDVYFSSRVYLQDEEGNYSTSLPTSETFEPLHSGGRYTVRKLIPGRRFRVELEPRDQTGNQFTDARKELKVIFEEYTSCTTESEDEYTGRPINFQIFQSIGEDEGLLSFSYRHMSVCSSAYALTRQYVDEASTIQHPIITFAPTYLHSAEDNYDNEIQLLGVDFKDRVSALEVGSKYNYCVFAVDNKYMVNTTRIDGRLSRRSEKQCKDHTVEWEASAVVKVTLKEDSGNEPVEDVIVSWALLSPDGSEQLLSGTELTTANGQVGPLKLKVTSLILAEKNIVLTGKHMLPLKVSFRKVSEGITHTFLCEDETILCPSDGFIRYLSHLDFRTLIHSVDATTLLLEGNVYSGMKDAESGLVHYTGCPLHNIQVCLMRKTPHGQDISLNCTNTDRNGYYKLFAVIGTYVYPQVKLTGHEFEPLHIESGKRHDDRAWTYVGTGIHVTPVNRINGGLSQHDFFDTTTAKLKVEIAGGACDISLGKATVKVTLENCDEKTYGQVFAQDKVHGEYDVPAHVIFSRITSLQHATKGDRQFVMDMFDGVSRRVDLSLAEETVQHLEQWVESTSSTDETPTYAPSTSPSTFAVPSDASSSSSLNNEDVNIARFQYDGILVMKPNPIEIDQAGICHPYKITNMAKGSSESFHVLQSKQSFELNVSAKRMIIPQENGKDPQFCNIVRESISIDVLNSIGLVSTDPFDRPMLDFVGENDKPSYTRCTSPNPCNLPVTDLSNSTYGISLELKVGIPRKELSNNDKYNYAKTIVLSSGSTIHTMYVIVTGDFPSSGGDYFTLPFTKPILVIRDPPGGLSSVTYKNVQTTMRVSHEHFERYDGIDNANSVHATVKADSSISVGLGVSDESATLHGDADVGGYDDDFQRSWLQDMRDDTHSHELVVEWSYSTAGSDGAGFAGKLSDVFLVPTIQILYKETQTVNFNAKSCIATISTSTKFDIASLENRQAISFLSYRQVTTETLPELLTQLENLDNTQILERETIEASISGWYQSLAEYEEVNTLAWNGNLKKTGKLEEWQKLHNEKPHCQFALWDESTLRYRCKPFDLEPNLCEACKHFTNENSKWYCSSVYDDCEENWRLQFTWDYFYKNWTDIPDDHPYWNILFNSLALDPEKASTSLVSSSLTNDISSKNITSVANLLAKSGRNYDNFIEEVDHVQFSGGGNVMTIEFDDEKMEEHIRMYNHPEFLGENSDFHTTHGFSGNFEYSLGMKILTGVKLSTKLEYVKDTSRRMSSGDGTSRKSSVKVELGDADVGDEFLVGIYIDPMHGTFVFNTTAGQSKCPHENNTNPVELPSVSVIQPENPVVQLDEPMVFELEIANHGYGDSSFVLYHEVLDNPDGLMINTFSSDTRTWILPSTYHGGTATKTTLTVSRGPKLNVYSPVRIYLQSKCGFALENGDSINEAVLYNKVVANDDGTSSKFIEFTESCQEVQWSSSSSLGKYKTFLLNTKSEKIMPITIQNPSSVPLQNKEKLKSVGLQYRKASEGFHEWIDGLQSDGKKINFKKNTEDFLGFITSEWKYPLIDGIYEIRLKSTCDCERCPLFLKEYTSESVFGYVDLTPPRVFGEPTPAGNLSPGEAVTIDFTEDIDCGIPYSFDVWIEVSEITSIIFGNIDLDIICSKNSIILKFRKDRIPAKTLKQLLGRSYILSVEGVKDKSGNIMEERFIFNSNFECLPPKPELKISFNRSREYLPHEPMIFDITISNKQWNWESNVAELQMDNISKEESAEFPDRNLRRKGKGQFVVFTEVVDSDFSFLVDQNPTIHKIRDSSERSSSYLEFGVKIRTNNNDLTILANGEPLVSDQVYKLRGDDDISTTIAVLKGPGNRLTIPPVTLFLRSHCSTDSHNPIEVTGDLWNWESGESSMKFIKFTPPCPSIEWAGSLVQRQHPLTLGGDTLLQSDYLLEVSILNQGFMERKLFDRSIHNAEAVRVGDANLAEVILLYRNVGFSDSSTWNQGILRPNANRSLYSISQDFDFSTENVEDDFGYATLFWDLQNVSDGSFDVKVISRCTSNSSSIALRDFSTEVIQIVLDRVPPKVYGYSDFVLPSSDHPASKEYSIQFTEDIKCGRPFVFDIFLRVFSVDDSIELKDDDGIHVMCIGQSIKFRFDGERYNQEYYELFTSSNIQVHLQGVQDLAGNYQASNFSMAMTSSVGASRKLQDVFLDHRASKRDNYVETSTKVFDVIKHQGCNGIDENADGIVDDCSEDNLSPLISISECTLTSKYEKDENILIVTTPSFKSLEDAKTFLQHAVRVVDDCAIDLDVEILSRKGSCADTVFTVIARDKRCFETNPLQSVSKDIVLMVDSQVPVVDAGFEYDFDEDYSHRDGKVLHVHESVFDFETLRFWYNITDDCPQVVDVELSVFSNEYEYSLTTKTNTMVVMSEKGPHDKKNLTQIYVQPRACKRDRKSKHICEHDPDIPIRFYEIHIRATDYGGNVGSVILTVIIVPDGADQIFFQNTAKTPSFFVDMVTKSTSRHALITKFLEVDVV